MHVPFDIDVALKTERNLKYLPAIYFTHNGGALAEQFLAFFEMSPTKSLFQNMVSSKLAVSELN